MIDINKSVLDALETASHTRIDEFALYFEDSAIHYVKLTFVNGDFWGTVGYHQANYYNEAQQEFELIKDKPIWKFTIEEMKRRIK